MFLNLIVKLKLFILLSTFALRSLELMAENSLAPAGKHFDTSFGVLKGSFFLFLKVDFFVSNIRNSTWLCYCFCDMLLYSCLIITFTNIWLSIERSYANQSLIQPFDTCNLTLLFWIYMNYLSVILNFWFETWLSLGFLGRNVYPLLYSHLLPGSLIYAVRFVKRFRNHQFWRQSVNPLHASLAYPDRAVWWNF